MFDCLFKQKTAYEMRIRDWSADVCSSDLAAPRFGIGKAVCKIPGEGAGGKIRRVQYDSGWSEHCRGKHGGGERRPLLRDGAGCAAEAGRSEESRGGKECVCKCRIRWSPTHLYK